MSLTETELSHLEDELETIRHHIRLTKEHIEELTLRFASYKPPPSIFVTVSEPRHQNMSDGPLLFLILRNTRS